MKSTIEAVRAIGNVLIKELDLGLAPDTDICVGTVRNMDKVYFRTMMDTDDWLSITASSEICGLVDAYNYLIFGKARKLD